MQLKIEASAGPISKALTKYKGIVRSMGRKETQKNIKGILIIKKHIFKVKKKYT
jgi:hypothetical protein